MPIKYIIDYLNQHKNKFPLSVLKKKLIESGYPENEVEEAIKIIQLNQAPNKFWDLKRPKVYLSSREKFLDCLFGILIGIILETLIRKTLSILAIIFSSFIRGLFFPIATICYIGLMIHFFKIKRSYLSLGIILKYVVMFYKLKIW